MKLQAKLKPGYEYKAKKVHIGLIKAECIKYAANNDMKVIELTDEVFKATGPNCMVHVDLLNVYIKVGHGWTVEEILQNESNYVDE